MSIDYDKLREWLDMVDRANHQAGDTITFTYPGNTVEIIRELLRLRDGVERYRDAGLLAPDLPAPAATSANGTPVWRADDTLMVTRCPDGEIRMLLGWGHEARYTPDAARAQAALLLAAANHAPENRKENAK